MSRWWGWAMGGMGESEEKKENEEKEQPSPRERLAALAREQYGLISLKQIRAHVQAKEKVRWIRDSGDFVRVHRSVYCFPGVPPCWEQQALAALMVCGPSSALSHRSAGFVLGLDGVKPVGVEVTVPEMRHVSNGAIEVHRTARSCPPSSWGSCA